MNSKTEWGSNSIPRQTISYMDSEWKGQDARQTLQTGESQQKSQPDSQTDRGKRLRAPNNFEDQYSQRKKKQRQDKQTQQELQERPKSRQKPTRFHEDSRHPDRHVRAVRHNQTMFARPTVRQISEGNTKQIFEGQQNGSEDRHHIELNPRDGQVQR